MKKIVLLLFSLIFLLLFSLILILAGCNNDPSKKINKDNLKKAQQEMAQMNKFPKMSFNTEQIDFGRHKEGAILDTVFVFTNTGDAPLIISNVRSSCGCTIPQWPKHPIQPGETGKIKVRFNSHHKKGHNIKTITIYDNEKSLTHTLKIIADIDPNPALEKNNKLGKHPKKLPNTLVKELQKQARQR